jgi:hypothetical protein
MPQPEWVPCVADTSLRRIPLGFAGLLLSTAACSGFSVRRSAVCADASTAAFFLSAEHLPLKGSPRYLALSWEESAKMRVKLSPEGEGAKA